MSFPWYSIKSGQGASRIRKVAWKAAVVRGKRGVVVAAAAVIITTVTRADTRFCTPFSFDVGAYPPGN